MMMRSGSQMWRFVFVASLALVWASGSAFAESDWSQWGGAKRNFKSDSKGLAAKWPEAGPAKLWSVELGDGYSAVIRDGENLYTGYSIRKKLEEDKWAKEGKEAFICLDAATGKKKWEYAYDAPWTKDMGMNFGPGPHSTPLVVGDKLFTVGCTCKVHCLDKNTGKVIWSKDLGPELEPSSQGHGFGASPVAYKDTIILPIGGKGKAVVALRQSDGEFAWKSLDSGGTYASPFIVEIDGVANLIVFNGDGANGLDPATGKLYWNCPHKTTYDANISTPVWCKDNILFVSSAYGNGARGIQVKKEGEQWSAKELWYNPKMKIHHANAVTKGDYVYGSSGDMGPAFFAAVNIKTGEFAWKKRGISKANCVMGDKKLFVLDEDGRLALAKVNSKKMRILSKAQICDHVAWTVPTLVGRTLYVRDRSHVSAFDVGEMTTGS